MRRRGKSREPAGTDAAIASERREIARLEAIASNDRDAFDALYREYFPRLMDFLARLVGHGGLAEEVINDTMYVVWTRADTFGGRSRVSTWIFGIAYKQAMKRLEREGRARLDKLPDDWEPDARQLSVDSAIPTLQLQDMLDKAMQRLSPSHRSVVELTYQFGYSYAEIAEIVGCPENTVKTRMHHARTHLRRILEILAKREGE
tara:strand:+ start:221 stop:832 length:612 start_codon:yes stop_codon:yes gene_type:complete